MEHCTEGAGDVLMCESCHVVWRRPHDKAPPLPGAPGSLENENGWGGLGGSVRDPGAAESERPVLAGSTSTFGVELEILEKTAPVILASECLQ